MTTIALAGANVAFIFMRKTGTAMRCCAGN